jgi:hypothetical protein
MKYSHFFLVPLLLFILILSGCSSIDKADKNSEMIQENTALQEKNSQLATELAAKKDLTATLQVQLLAKKSEIKRLKAIRQDLGREVTRRQTRIQTPESKAEAVIVLAEAEADINAARERMQGNSRKPAFDMPDQLMAESKSELGRSHYAKACSLAGEALEMVRSMELKTETGAKPQKNAHFSLPLAMQLSKKSNIRENPGMDAQVLHVLDQGTTVMATEYKGHWIKIIIKGEQFGWIHYSLLTLPET